jgi:DNA polymerase-4
LSRLRSTILHLDLDAFFCAVEEWRNPALSGKAFVVAGRPNERGVVSSASYPARRFGVRNAMPTATALRLCPQLVIVPASHGVYAEYSARVMTLLHDYGDQIEQLSVDEAFLDVTDLTDDARLLALEIQRRIRAEVGLSSSIGVATGKLVAKMASGAAKPNGVLVIEPGGEIDFLARMPVGELWGIGKATLPRLERLGIRTIGDLQRAAPHHVRSVFHNQAEAVIARANGIDESPVRAERETKSISEERTFSRDVSDPAVLRRMLLSLSDEIAVRLRADGLFARTVHIKLRWHDFYTVTRQTTLAEPTQLGDDIFAAAEPLWQAAWLERGAPDARLAGRTRGDPIRLIGVAASSFSEGEQASLFGEPARTEKLALARALDALHKQYGSDVVTRASLKR